MWPTTFKNIQSLAEQNRDISTILRVVTQAQEVWQYTLTCTSILQPIMVYDWNLFRNPTRRIIEIANT